MRIRAIPAVAAVLGWSSAAAASDLFTWMDSDVAWWYAPNFREPGVTRDGKAFDIPKNVISLTHIDGWAYGQNFFDLDILKSTPGDIDSSGHNGALEFYGLERSDFSIPRISGWEDAVGKPLRDVFVEVGADMNSKDTTFDSEKRLVLAGMAVAFDVPGFFKLAALWNREYSHNGITGVSFAYHSTARIEGAWNYHLPVDWAPLSFEGYAVINGPKGKDGFGDKTVTEYLFHPKFMLDVGTLLDWGRVVKVGIGDEYWFNKFGDNHTLTQGAIANATFVEVNVHF